MNFNPAGQIIGRATTVRRTKDVVLGIVEEYIEAVEKLQRLIEEHMQANRGDKHE